MMSAVPPLPTSHAARNSTDAAPLSAGALIAFALLNAPLAAAQMPMGAYLPAYYAQHLGAGLAMAGSLLMLSRIWNALLDPVVGLLSDRTRTRFGRRKPWIAIGGALFLAGACALFIAISGATNAWYLGIWLVVFYLGWTMVSIPLSAWSGELSQRYHERSRVQTYAQTVTAVGLLLVLLIPAALDWVGRHELDEKIRTMGWFIVITLIPSLYLCLFRVRETVVDAPAAAHASGGALRAAKILFTDTLLLRVIASDLAVSLGQGMRGALFILFVTHCAGLPTWASSLWLLQFVFGVFAAPIWLRLSYRIGKHRTAVVGELVQVATNLGLLAVGVGDAWLLVALTIGQGLAQGSGNLMLRAIVADVADLQRLRSGEERAGLLFSIFNMTNSLAMALAVGLAFTLVGWFGFVPSGSNSAEALRGVQWVFAIGPALCHLLSAVLVWNFPLDQRRHAEIAEQLRARDGVQSGA
jgi:Na+/melibiose symporter-like transporter